MVTIHRETVMETKQLGTLQSFFALTIKSLPYWEALQSLRAKLTQLRDLSEGEYSEIRQAMQVLSQLENADILQVLLEIRPDNGSYFAATSKFGEIEDDAEMYGAFIRKLYEDLQDLFAES